MKAKRYYLFAAALVATLAWARPESSHDITYYADASLSTEVGTGFFNCSGKTLLYSGVKTEYYTFSNEESCS